MKAIKHSVYENLTPQQRINATIEAMAREDQEEVQRLVKTCPTKTYDHCDLEYMEKMDGLLSMAVAVECDLRGNALSYLVALHIKHETTHQFLQNIADIRAAWRHALEAMGIDPEMMASAALASSPILGLIDGVLPEPEQEQVVKMAAELSGCMK